MSIENPNAFLASIWDWKPLRGCFPRGIEPTDLDGWVEVGGYFFVLEGKAPDVPLKEGQRLAFERMHRWNQTVPGLFTIVVIWGHAATARIDKVQFWPTDPFPAGWDDLRSYASAWAEVAVDRAKVNAAPAVTWAERANNDPSLRAFIDAEIARAGIELDTKQYNAGHFKQIAEHWQAKFVELRAHRKTQQRTR